MKFEEYSDNIAKRLHELRIYRSYKQSEVAKLLNVSQRTYEAYEQGKRVLPLEKLLSLCELYRITPNELLGYEETARVAVICDKYGIKYKTIDSHTVMVMTEQGDFKIPKPIFCEIIFKSERMINHIDIQSEHLKELRQYESELIKTFIDYEIYFSSKADYTLEEMEKDLKKIKVAPIDESEGGKK